MHILYEKEFLTGKSFLSNIETFEQFLEKKKQNPVQIINYCIDNQFDYMFRLIACCYFYGKWVEKDESKAFIYYQKSADMGDVNGMFNVGFCYQYGIGVEQ